MLKKGFFFIFILYSSQSIGFECQHNLQLFDFNMLEQLSVPNCTQELIMGKESLCECANDYKKFQDKNDLKPSQEANPTFLMKKAEKKLLRMSEGKIASIIYDLEYANSMLNISQAEKEELLRSCNLPKLKELTNKLCNGKLLADTNIDSFIDKMKNEAMIIHTNSPNINKPAFFDRSSSETCNLSDHYINQIRNFRDLSSLLDKSNSEKSKISSRFESNPIGRYLKLAKKEVNLNNLNDLNDIKAILSDNENKEAYMQSFQRSCQKDLEIVADVLCSNLSESTLPFDEFESFSEVKEQYYEDSPFDSKKFFKDQNLILQYCNHSQNEYEDKFSPLSNLLKYGQEKFPEFSEINPNSNGLFDMGLLEDEEFIQKQYKTHFTDIRKILCDERPITKKTLQEKYHCSLDNFTENFKNVSSSEQADNALCPTLVLDYILNTPTEELETQNIDKNLIAYKKNIEENKKSNGGDLILDFLGVQSPKDVEIFKEAGIERKTSNQSDDNSKNGNSSDAPSVAVQKKNTPNNNAINSYAQTSNTTGPNSQETYNRGNTQNYQNSPTYENMSPQEKSQISNVERELMRRLMGSKVSENSNAARAEMYEKYSKEMMELAKEKMRIEAASEKPSSKELAAYDKKMQDMVNKMRAENKKLATALNNSSEGTSPNNSSNDNLNSSSGTPNKGSNFMATTASSHEREVINPNSKFNRALNETVNAEKFYELTGKKPDQNTQTDRSLASNSSSVALTLIENDKIIDISSLKEVLSIKLQEKKPFVIAQKDNPDFKVRIIPGNENEVTIAPLGDLNNPSYKMFYEEIEQSYQEIQEYHLGELTNKLLEIR